MSKLLLDHNNSDIVKAGRARGSKRVGSARTRGGMCLCREAGGSGRGGEQAASGKETNGRRRAVRDLSVHVGGVMCVNEIRAGGDQGKGSQGRGSFSTKGSARGGLLCVKEWSGVEVWEVGRRAVRKR